MRAPRRTQDPHGVQVHQVVAPVGVERAVGVAGPPVVLGKREVEGRPVRVGQQAASKTRGRPWNHGPWSPAGSVVVAGAILCGCVAHGSPFGQDSYEPCVKSNCGS